MQCLTLEVYGVRMPDGHYEKVLREHEASTHDSNGSLTAPSLRHRLNPSPAGVPGEMEHSGGEEGLTLEKLAAEVKKLRKEKSALEDQVAEIALWRMDMEDRFTILRKGCTSKIKRLFKETGFEDLYEAPSLD